MDENDLLKAAIEAAQETINYSKEELAHLYPNDPVSPYAGGITSGQLELLQQAARELLAMRWRPIAEHDVTINYTQTDEEMKMTPNTWTDGPTSATYGSNDYWYVSGIALTREMIVTDEGLKPIYVNRYGHRLYY